MSSRPRPGHRGVAHLQAGIAYQGSHNRSPFAVRREAAAAGGPLPDGYVCCPECFRVVPVTTKGCIRGHNHCPRGGTPIEEV